MKGFVSREEWEEVDYILRFLRQDNTHTKQHKHRESDLRKLINQIAQSAFEAGARLANASHSNNICSND